MDPQNYPTSQDPNQNTDQSVKNWFDAIPSTEPPVNTPEPGSGSHKKLLLFIIGGISLLVVGGVAALMSFGTLSVQSVGTCLANDHLKSLTGTTVTETLSPQDNFYTRSFDFTLSSSNYAPTSQAESEAFIKKVGTFYKSYGDDSSIIFTITGDYNYEYDTEEAAKARVSKLRSALEKQGVPEIAIKTQAPTPFSADNELPEDSEELKVAKTYLSITSDQKCSR